MKYGAVFPQLESGTDVTAIRDYFQAVEEMGFDYVVAYDHILGANPDREGGWRGPYTHTESFHEIFVLFAYIAAITERIEFTSGILILPQRQTALVAKQAAQIDLLSGGRLRLGIGIGWNEVEYIAQNENFKNRGKRSEEQVELLRELWTKELVTFDGKYHNVPDAGLNPMPVQRPIPLWFGGGADVVLRRMARLGDGWMPNTMPVERAKPMVDTLRGYLQDNGRSLDDFGIDVRVNMKQTPTPESWVEFLDAWRGMGMTHTALNTMGMNYPSLDAHLATLEQFINTVKS